MKLNISQCLPLFSLALLALFSVDIRSMNDEVSQDKKIESKDSQYKKPSPSELKETLTPLQYKVAVKNGTERPFKNEFWDNKEPGLYVDIATGQPLFHSKDKFDSGTGWPSFIRPIDDVSIVEKDDSKFFMKRTEVRSKIGDIHLGHVFPDGPQPTGMRYCINSAALRFVHLNDLKEKGYGEYLELFKK